MRKIPLYVITISILISAFLTGCKSTPQTSQSEVKKEISLVFAGDIMAHRPNFNMTDYSKIWTDIKDIITDSDFAFANLESPVDDELPYSAYPDFNMHREYPEAAIQAGFNVFSIINNHTNDQGIEGMRATLKWAKEEESKTADSARPVYFEGIKSEPNLPVSYRVIQKNGWSILYCAVTEIINRPNYRAYMNYVVASAAGWEEFSEYLKKIREQNPCDIFILSIHTDEPEYIAPVSQKRKDYYHKLLNQTGVDIVYTNHPHIVRERELIGENETKQLSKAIIYGNGNIISGQRWEPDFDNPENPRDDTGDGFIWKIKFTKSNMNPEPVIEKTESFYITTYINTAWEFVVKKLDDEFITYLKDIGRTKWAAYIEKRKEITEKTKENVIWQ